MDNDAQMYVIKRDGKRENIKFDSITKRNEKLANLLNLKVDLGKLSQKVIMSLKNGMKTEEIDELSADEAYGMSSRNPEYGRLSSYITINNHQKKCPKNFKECIEKLYNFYDEEKKKHVPLITKDVYDFTMKYIDVIEKVIDSNKDFYYDYFGFKTLQKAYLLPFNSNITIETPQYMLMRVCIGLFGHHSIDINKINLKNKVQKYLINKCKLYLYIKHKTNEELINMTINDWNELIKDLALHSQFDVLIQNYSEKIYNYIQNIIKPLEGDINKVIERYKTMSDHLYTCASPTLFNSGTDFNQLASCFLVSIPDDLSKMYDFLKQIALISSRGGGIGLDLSLIRAKGSKISSTQSTASGILPYLRMLDNACLHASQGRRKGSFACYLQPWHLEIMTFLQIRLPDALSDIRCPNLFTACYIPNLFFERVKNNEKWSLFCPSKLNLVDVYGDEFNKLYLDGEEKKLYDKQLPAKEVYEAILFSRQKSGTPYMLNKDSINEKNMQSNIGTIRCSNLCCEIVEYSNEKNIAVCNLTSISLPRFVKSAYYNLNLFNNDIDNLIKSYLYASREGVNLYASREGVNLYASREGVNLYDSEYKYFDFEEFGKIVEICTENCDRIIDINLYPVKNTKFANKYQRPIGVGVQGLDDVYKMMKYAWTDKEAFDLNKSIFSTMYYHFLKKSNELALKYGSYPGFEGSNYSKGILQYHLWKVEPDTSIISKEKWNNIENDVKLGIRNSLGIALMPTASTSQILGNVESFEPSTYNLYSRGTLSGTFYQINKHLYKDLKDLNMWNNDIVNQIIKDRGSIQNIKTSDKLKQMYKTVWELSQKIIIDQAYDRSPYIDQTQSLNLYIEKPTFAVLSSMDMYAYGKQLKTMCYYTRSKSSMDANMFTIMEDTIKKMITNTNETNKNETNNE